jgi:Pyridine nucleotide-disulphide oxidoreductase
MWVWSLLKCTADLAGEVTVVEMGPRLVQREDEEVSEAIKTILENEGIHIRLDAECIALEKRGDKVAVNVDCSSGDKTIVGSRALLRRKRIGHFQRTERCRKQYQILLAGFFPATFLQTLGKAS